MIIKQINMEGGQGGTYLRLTRVLSGPRESAAKTYRDETKWNCEYFGQITVAFLSSRIQETEVKFLSAAEARVDRGGVNGYWDRGCVVIGGQIGMQFQPGGGCGLGWSQVIGVWH